MAIRYQSGIDYGQVGQAIERDLQEAQQFIAAGFQTEISNRLQEQKFINTVLENLESLKDEGDLAHQKEIAGEVDKTLDLVKEKIYKYRTTKKNEKKFKGYNFDPEALREVKNAARNIKNAALRSEQARTAYDQAVKTIATDPTIINKTKAVEELDAKFKSKNILFPSESIEANNPSLVFSKVIENNIDTRSAIGNAASALAGGKMTDVGYTTAEGKTEVIKYNLDYYTPQISDGQVTGFTQTDAQKARLDKLVQQVYGSRRGISERTTIDEVRAEIESVLNPVSQLRMVEQKPEEIKLTESDRKRLLEEKKYIATTKAFDAVGDVIDKGEYPSEQDYAKINKTAGKEALKNVKFINLPDVKKNYTSGVDEIIGEFKDIDNSRVEKLVAEYEALSDTEKVTKGLTNLIEGVRDELGEKKAYENTFSLVDEVYAGIQPYQQYVTKDYGILVKDSRGKGDVYRFVEDSTALSAFGTTVYDTPAFLLGEESVPEESTESTESTTKTDSSGKILIPGITPEDIIIKAEKESQKNKKGAYTPASEEETEKERKKREFEADLAAGLGQVK